MNRARTEVLNRIAAARPGGPAPQAVARDYLRTGSRSPEERLSLFCERVSDYHADVRRIATSEVACAVADACRPRDAQRLVVPPGLPARWRPTGSDLIEDDGLTPRELDRVDGVITGCTVAIADTGTIALAAGPHEGRRAISLIPDLHVCVVEEHQIVELVPEAIAELADLVARERPPITLISGPSATSDIELSRVEGVHGPRTLVVLVVMKET